MSNFPITHVVLHYSATYADQDIGVKEIDAMHRKRGWNGVGYHYVIRRNGTIEQGRPESRIGAHVGGQNTGKIGICCIGGLERATGNNVGVDNRTMAQKAATLRLIRDIISRHPNAKVVGHRDLAATQCPGFDVQTWWANANRPADPVAPPAPRPSGNPFAALIALFRSIFGGRS